MEEFFFLSWVCICSHFSKCFAIQLALDFSSIIVLFSRRSIRQVGLVEQGQPFLSLSDRLFGVAYCVNCSRCSWVLRPIILEIGGVFGSGLAFHALHMHPHERIPSQLEQREWGYGVFLFLLQHDEETNSTLSTGYLQGIHCMAAGRHRLFGVEQLSRELYLCMIS